MTIAKKITIKDLLNTVYGIKREKKEAGFWALKNGVYEFKAMN